MKPPSAPMRPPPNMPGRGDGAGVLSERDGLAGEAGLIGAGRDGGA